MNSRDYDRLAFHNNNMGRQQVYLYLKFAVLFSIMNRQILPLPISNESHNHSSFRQQRHTDDT
jgi:hypothetical protein